MSVREIITVPDEILKKVSKRIIKSLEQLNNKKEDIIINELTSFNKDQI